MLVQLTLSSHLDPFFAEGAEAEIEEDPRSKPLYFKSFLQAFHMENVTTGASDARRCRKGLDIADCTVLVAINSLQLIIVLRAFLVQAGKA